MVEGVGFRSWWEYILYLGHDLFHGLSNVYYAAQFCCHSVTIQTAQRTSTDSELGPDLFSGYPETAILNPTFYKVYKNHTRPLKIQYKSLWPTRQSYTEELIRPLITGSTVYVKVWIILCQTSKVWPQRLSNLQVYWKKERKLHICMPIRLDLVSPEAILPAYCWRYNSIRKDDIPDEK